MSSAKLDSSEMRFKAAVKQAQLWIEQFGEVDEETRTVSLVHASWVHDVLSGLLLFVQPEVTPICYVIAVEEYGQMVVYGPQYRVRESAEQDARLPKMRDQKAEVWACYRSRYVGEKP